MSEILKGGDAVEIKMVSISRLKEHELQTELSPSMTEKSWKQFVAGIRDNGILQPLIATKDGSVIDGKNRLRAAKELGIAGVRVVYEDIPENDIAEYITRTKLDRDDLTKGQRACIVLNLYYEEERRKAKERMSVGGKTKVSPNGETINVHEVLAKRSGIGKSSVGRLIEVKRKRLDLYANVFNGNYSIGKAHAEMKADEEPKKAPIEKPLAVEAKAILKEAIEREQSNPQLDESQPAHSPHNRVVNMRKKALHMTADILEESDTLEKAEPVVKDSARTQLLALARSCVISLGQTAESDEDAEILAVCLELLKKINGGNAE
jgi:hypothetical protein